MDFEEEIANTAFDVAIKRGRKFKPDGCYRGGYRYKSKRFGIEFLFADGPDFCASDLSDCSYLKISYNGKKVFSYDPWHATATCYKPGRWGQKLEQLESRVLPKPKGRNNDLPFYLWDWEDQEAEFARMNRDWAKYGRTHND